MKRIIIDTDPGVDDSMAILLAFNSPEHEIKAQRLSSAKARITVFAA